MPKIETIHVPLTPLQQTLLEKMRPYLPQDFSDDDIQSYVVAHGLLAAGAQAPDDEPVIPNEVKRRPIDERIELHLGDRLRDRLERLLGFHPRMTTREALSLLLELGLETLIELGVAREADVGSAESRPSTAFREVE